MAAFVMAYSFTERDSSNEDEEDDDDDDDDDIAEVKSDDSAPAMVPMADILNHISNHNAHLEFGAGSLTMVATQDIHKVKITGLSASSHQLFSRKASASI